MTIFLIDHKNGCGCEQVTADTAEEACAIYRSSLTVREGDYEMSAVELVADTICGKHIQHDDSGVGHDWRWVSADSISADTVEDISAAINDGLDSCTVWIADGGEHYRW